MNEEINESCFLGGILVLSAGVILLFGAIFKISLAIVLWQAAKDGSPYKRISGLPCNDLLMFRVLGKWKKMSDLDY